MASRRLERVAAQVVREVGTVIEQRLSDPDLGFVTVHRATVTRDLRLATVFIGVLGDADQARASIRALQRARGLIRHDLAHRLRLRVTPDLRFQLDPSMLTEERLRQLLDDTSHETSPAGDPNADLPDA